MGKTIKTFLLIALALFAMEVDAQTTRYVNATGTDAGNCTDPSNACATIDYAIAMAGSGDMIDIAPGVYTEQLNIEKDLTFQGAGSTQADGTIIQAHVQPGQASGRTVSIIGNYTVAMSGLLVRHGVMGAGSGIYVSNANLTLNDVAITANTASSSGGGLFLSGSASATLTDVNFTDNTAGYGGAVYSLGSATLMNVSFTDNTATFWGGGMYTSDTAMLTSVNFTGNTVEEGDGGALHISNSTVIINDVTFTNNQTQEGFGGAVYISESTADFINAHFTNNYTPDEGGAVYITESMADFSGSTFIENEARIGGGLLVENQSSVTLDNILFEGNKVPTSSAGMAVGGGMLVLNQSEVTIHNTHFKDNEASEFGGGFANEAATTTIVNSLFTGNKATNLGGGAIINNGDLNLINTTVTQNGDPNVIAGGVYNFQGTTTMLNSIVWGNIGDIADIGNANGAVLTGNFSLYDESNSLNEGTLTCDDCLTINPDFADAPGGDFTLSASSPAIDAGDPNTNLSEFPTDGNNNPIDLAGDARVFNSIIDMGAYEYSTLATQDFNNTGIQVVMYPNPVNDILHIETKQNIKSLAIYTPTGQHIQTWKDQNSIDLSTYPMGIYFVKITTQNTSTLKQVIKK